MKISLRATMGEDLCAPRRTALLAVFLAVVSSSLVSADGLNKKETHFCRCLDCDTPCNYTSSSSKSACSDSCEACRIEPYNCQQFSWGTEKKCFAGSSTVELRSGDRVPMTDLKLGDEVLVGAGMYSEVYFFSHSDGAVKTAMLSFELDGHPAGPLVISHGHFVYADGDLKAAREVAVGSVLRLADGSPGTVTTVRELVATGLFNPHTAHGDIVVDGVTTSCLTDAVPPALAEWLLWPVKIWRRGFGAAATVI